MSALKTCVHSKQTVHVHLPCSQASVACCLGTNDCVQVFDVTAVRNALESRLKSLESELHQVCHLSVQTVS